MQIQNAVWGKYSACTGLDRPRALWRGAGNWAEALRAIGGEPAILPRQQRFLSVTDRNQPVNWRAAVNQRIREFLARLALSELTSARAALSPILG